VNEASVKATLLALIGKVEDLEASQVVIIQALRQLSKGTLSAADVQSAIGRAKSSSKKHYDGLRKAVGEISS
jgi:hypothetical protein